MLSFRIDAYTHNRLRELAEASGAGLSVLIRALLLHVLEELTDEEIRERMSGNICRCGAYNGVVEAVAEVVR